MKSCVILSIQTNFPYEYTTKLYHASIPVSEYLDKYVDVETFFNACKSCPNFDKVWSCPSYDFDVLSYWRQYRTLLLTARKITFSKEALSMTFPPKEVNEIINRIVLPEKQKLTDMLMEEGKLPHHFVLVCGLLIS